MPSVFAGRTIRVQSGHAGRTSVASPACGQCPLPALLSLRLARRERVPTRHRSGSLADGSVHARNPPNAQPAEALAATRSGASASRNRRVHGGLPMFERSGHRHHMTGVGVVGQPAQRAAAWLVSGGGGRQTGRSLPPRRRLPSLRSHRRHCNRPDPASRAPGCAFAIAQEEARRLAPARPELLALGRRQWTGPTASVLS
jgi:hypothetical protein